MAAHGNTWRYMVIHGGGRKGGTNTAIPHVVAREYRNTAHGRERKPQYRVKIYPNTEIETNGEKLPF